MRESRTPDVIAVALLGRSIGASASPAIHEREARHIGMPLLYRLADFDAIGLGDDQLGHVLNLLAGMGFAGVNVTHPFKQRVMPFLDDIDRTAAQIGAVNTIQFLEGSKRGFNTDAIGFRWLMESDLSGADLSGVAQIGAGGAGSATCYALLEMGAREVAIHDRDRQRAMALVARVQTCFPDARLTVCDSAAEAVNGASGVVQTTPIGMSAHPGSPFDAGMLDRRQWLADVIYFPRETELVRAAAAAGVRAVGGASMVIGQAAEAFRLFTGHRPNLARMAHEFRDGSSSILVES